MCNARSSLVKVLLGVMLFVLFLSSHSNAELQVTLSDPFGEDFIIADGGPEDMDGEVNGRIVLQYSMPNSFQWSVSATISQTISYRLESSDIWAARSVYEDILVENMLIEHLGGDQAVNGSIKIESSEFEAPQGTITLSARLEGDYIKVDPDPIPPEIPPIPLHSADILMSGWANGAVFSTLDPICIGDDCLNPIPAGADFHFLAPEEYVPGTAAYTTCGMRIAFLLGPPDNTVIPPVPQDGIRINHAYTKICNCVGIRGNANKDPIENVNISDITFLINYLYGTSEHFVSICRDEASANGDAGNWVNISDVTYMVQYLFGIPSGPASPDCP